MTDCFLTMLTIDSSALDIVWLDLDDTVIDFRANSRRALERVYAEGVLPAGLFDSPKTWTESYERHNSTLWGLYNRAEITRDYLRMERFCLPLTEAGMDRAGAENLSVRLDTVYLDYLAQEHATVDGAMELIADIRRHGMLTGVLSNGFSDVQHRKMRSAGLDGLIDITVLSDDIGVNKPDVRLYRHAMERSGIANPQRHMMIGDNPTTDIAGAMEAGWQSALYNPTGLLRALAGVAEVTSLRQIRIE